MTAMSFDGRVVIVTGAARGLGRAYAMLLAQRGACVVINDLGVAIDGTGPSPEPAEAVASLIRAHGGKAIADHSDISTQSGVRSLVARTVEEFGAVDALVCNAGTIGYGTTPDKIEPDQFNSQLSLMVTGVGLLIGAAWDWLKRSGEGRIVLMSSAGGMFGIPANPYYTSAKGGVIGLLRGLAIDGAVFGIKVNAVCPLAYTRLFEGFSEDVAFNTWFKDNAKAEYVAPIVGYLAHSACEPTGRVFSSGLGHVSEVFIGLTAGWKQRAHSIEDIRDNFAQIVDRDGFAVPATAIESSATMFGDAPIG
ncbi:SDR family NAD(P)-dependent oxidoreductase [Novosphingobium cyanobacteriorum]|uniref:SDR family NAD(P)-dependent oxidoreductase n=1 Tax=Novosphingobium cyanobacteriorum TaxID=3024215 RepID=A0ABT6CN18_9SPHN|nr:SDR family NAD(P)-dependent oxidoreductase [Novosphingobium cyanobacteriorum]MDF8335316.1 SDR family NAD(P)-dependent oxidoreductase [Novosphingobium cyanobacteriorum]